MKAFPTTLEQEAEKMEGMDLRDYFAAHSGQEAIEFLNLYYGNDWLEQGEMRALTTLAKTKRRIGTLMLNEIFDEIEKKHKREMT